MLFRENLKVLLNDVNEQKKVLKETGIFVDGKHHNVEFVGMFLTSHSVVIEQVGIYKNVFDCLPVATDY